MARFKVGTVLRYFVNTQIAVVELENDLGTGDILKFESQGEHYTQLVSEILHEHQRLSFAKRGQIVGIAISHVVRPGIVLYK